MLRYLTTLSYCNYKCDILCDDEEDPRIYRGKITNMPTFFSDISTGPLASSNLGRITDWFQKQVDSYFKHCEDNNIIPTFRPKYEEDNDEEDNDEENNCDIAENESLDGAPETEHSLTYEETAIITYPTSPYTCNPTVTFCHDRIKGVSAMWKEEIEKLFGQDSLKAIYTKEYLDAIKEYNDILYEASVSLREVMHKLLDVVDRNIKYSYQYHTEINSILTDCFVTPHIEIELYADTEQSESPDKEIKMSYKGYDALIKGYEDGAYCGVVSGNKVGSDLVTFEADSFDDIWKEFTAAVDDYIEMKGDIDNAKKEKD